MKSCLATFRNMCDAPEIQCDDHVSTFDYQSKSECKAYQTKTVQRRPDQSRSISNLVNVTSPQPQTLIAPFVRPLVSAFVHTFTCVTPDFAHEERIHPSKFEHFFSTRKSVRCLPRVLHILTVQALSVCADGGDYQSPEVASNKLSHTIILS